MNDVRLEIQYQATRYNQQRQMLPQSAQTRSDALLAVLRHTGAIGSVMGLMDEERIKKAGSESLHLMLNNLGELLNLLTEAGISLLNEDSAEPPSSDGKRKSNK
ncbi:MAG: hypothetical protein SF097_14830 [Acidobacteriota bacterium]|nr:hypothetical protein [Acidobacteriota bacterium]